MSVGNKDEGTWAVLALEGGKQLSSPWISARARLDSLGKCVTSTRDLAQRGAWIFWKLRGRRGGRVVEAKGLCKVSRCRVLRGCRDLMVDLKSWQAFLNDQEDGGKCPLLK